MARKRIALSVDPEYHELLTQIAKYQNKTVTGVVTDFQKHRPTAEAMLKAFEDLYAGKSQDEVVNELLAVSFENFAKELREK